LYAAFGDKEQLYCAALKQYLAGNGTKSVWGVLNENMPTRKALQQLLESAAVEISKPGQPAGCMLSLAFMHGCPETARLRMSISKLRNQSREKIRSRIKRGVELGDMPRKTDPTVLARFFMTVLQGMSVQARDGASRRELVAIARAAMPAFES
jgi:AcrR family transcriptional regulator